MVAVQNTAREGKLPADVEISEALARVGAETLFASGQNLRRLLFDANVFFLTSDSRVAISIAGFRELFEDIAFVIFAPLPASWQSLDRPVCTCHVFAVQQQCQHTLFVESLGLPRITHPRNFDEVVSTRARGRPKGAAKPGPKRRQHQ